MPHDTQHMTTALQLLTPIPQCMLVPIIHLITSYLSLGTTNRLLFHHLLHPHYGDNAPHSVYRRKSACPLSPATKLTIDSNPKSKSHIIIPSTYLSHFQNLQRKMSYQPRRSRYLYAQEDPRNERAVTAPPRPVRSGQYPTGGPSYTPYAYRPEEGYAGTGSVDVRYADRCRECKSGTGRCSITDMARDCDQCLKKERVCIWNQPSQATEEMYLLRQERMRERDRCTGCGFRRTSCMC